MGLLGINFSVFYHGGFVILKGQHSDSLGWVSLPIISSAEVKTGNWWDIYTLATTLQATSVFRSKQNPT